MLSLATENDRDWQERNIVKRAGIHEAANVFWKKKNTKKWNDEIALRRVNVEYELTI